MQSSKFWQARNAWFALKARLRVNASGPQPHWVPEVDDIADVFERDPAYDRWLLANQTRPADVRRLRDLLPLLTLRPTFSVLMPVYETRERYLRDAIESVLAQAYPDWELCIADDASRSPHVREVLDEYAHDDERVKLVYRETNGHIAAASNSALAIARGEFVALLDHDDLLAPDALFENALVVNRHPDVGMIYSDEDKIDDRGRRSSPYFKPDWSPDSLLSRNYISHLGVYRRSIVDDVGGFRVGFEGSQDYDLALRVSERAGRIEHVPRVLYHWRIHEESTASTRTQKGYAYDAATRALSEALERRGEPGRIEPDEETPGIYTVRYAIARKDRVSIIVPTRNHGDDVERCLHSIFDRSTYPDFDVVLLDNGSDDPASLRTFGRWAAREPDRVQVVPYDVPFNFSRINNYAAAQASGTYLLFLNNDTEVITPDWLEAMVEQAQRPSIGAVGAKLLYDDGTVQHAGVVIGLGGVAGHSHKYYPGTEPGYFGTLQTVNNFSAVTAACLMVRRTVFDEVGRFDEGLAIAFNDVDLCLRIRNAGYYNVYLPHVSLYHYESKSRGLEDTPEKQARFLREQQVMHERWRTAIDPDPHYNVNLTRATEDFAIGI
ncbi:MAG: glycosyltransferase family 2 protein [Candidatus Eremiobacteraeota bacterium]|nr:glycosyltransferase family 2 protein [Candidatus Eremiobacteraeota bacterium]MBV9409880.1 glycosyltransferase family 2 protein [Candidatus Eremiobacteraeota bacterium]